MKKHLDALIAAASLAVLLLVLVTQVLILKALRVTPPTVAQLREAKDAESRTRIMGAIPLVQVRGGQIDASISDTLEVTISR